MRLHLLETKLAFESKVYVQLYPAGKSSFEKNMPKDSIKNKPAHMKGSPSGESEGGKITLQRISPSQMLTEAQIAFTGADSYFILRPNSKFIQKRSLHNDVAHKFRD